MKIRHLKRGTTRVIASAALCLTALLSASAADLQPARPSLDRGFRLLYDLDFDQAHQVFLSWERQYPQDPVGPTAEAAGLLFSEFHRLGILESQFYADDKSFLNREKVSPDPVLRDKFNAALAKAQSLATSRLATSPQDR